MNSKPTQKSIVIARLNEFGYVDNFWAIEHKVSLRLAAIIHILRKDGYEFEETFGSDRNKKNYYYYVTKKPGEAATKKAICCYSHLKFGTHVKFGTHAQDCPVVAKPSEAVKQRGMLL